MTHEDLKNLLSDAADEAPARDLAGPAVQIANRRTMINGLAAAGLAVVTLGLAGLLVINLARVPASDIVAGAPTATTSVQPTPTEVTSPTQPPDSPSATVQPTSPKPSEAAASATPPAPAQTTVTPKLANSTMPVAYAIPDSLQFTGDELPAGYKLLLDMGDYPLQPTADGLYCDAYAHPVDAAQPIAGRQWSWSTGTGFQSIGLVVSGWDDGALALQELVDGTGQCTFLEAYTTITTTPTSFVATTTSGGTLPQAIAIARLNNVLVAVTVTGAKGSDPAGYVEQATWLLDRAIAKAKAAGLQNA